MTEDATILRHHPCDRTLQVPLWRRCRGRQPSKAPRCWPTPPILPSIQNLSEVVPTRPYSGSLVPAAFATGSIRWDRTRLPRIPRCSLLPKERGAPVAPAIGLNLEAAGWLRCSHVWIHPRDLALRDSALTGSYAAAGDRLQSALPSTVGKESEFQVPPSDVIVNNALQLARLWRRIAEL